LKRLRSAPHPAALAAGGAAVIVVGDLASSLGYVEQLRRLGAEAEVYPLDPWKAPTLYSLLGLVGYILGAENEGQEAVLIDTGPGALVEQAYRLVTGERLDSLDPGELTSPLHYRLLAVLELLRRGGIDLAREAERHRVHAFTGGDAARSDQVLLAGDLEAQAGAGGAAAAKYRGGALPQPYEEVLAGLDPRGEGAVEVLALRAAAGVLHAYIGCRMLLHPRGCSPEAEALMERLPALAARLGAGRVEVEAVEPEEAACIAYPRYPC